jgi:hypothetical protein
MYKTKGSITDKILDIRKQIINISQSEIAIVDAFSRIKPDMSQKGFYQQCKLLKQLGYIEFKGFKQLSRRSRSTIMLSLVEEYIHGEKKEVEKQRINGNARVYSSDDWYWSKPELKQGKTNIGCSFNLIGW